MRTTAIGRATAALAGLLLLDAGVWAAPPGKCEFSKLKAAARYSGCLLEASARTLKHEGGSADAGSCDARLSSRWRRAEGKGMGQCPATDDQATQAFLQQCAAGVATGLAGNPLPTCGGSPAGAHLGTRAVLAAPAECQFEKLRTAGWYSSCRLRASARAVRSGGGTPDFSACDAKFAAKWARVEATGAGQCPSSDDEAAIQAFIVQCTDGVAAALGGGSLPTRSMLG